MGFSPVHGPSPTDKASHELALVRKDFDKIAELEGKPGSEGEIKKLFGDATKRLNSVINDKSMPQNIKDAFSNIIKDMVPNQRISILEQDVGVAQKAINLGPGGEEKPRVGPGGEEKPRVGPGGEEKPRVGPGGTQPILGPGGKPPGVLPIEPLTPPREPPIEE